MDNQVTTARLLLTLAQQLNIRTNQGKATRVEISVGMDTETILTQIRCHFRAARRPPIFRLTPVEESTIQAEPRKLARNMTRVLGSDIPVLEDDVKKST
jgi:hypothetical protein